MTGGWILLKNGKAPRIRDTEKWQLTPTSIVHTGVGRWYLTPIGATGQSILCISTVLDAARGRGQLLDLPLG
jgi:hypothetical protein